MSLLTSLAQVPDYRRSGGDFRHLLVFVLVISVLVVLNGGDDEEEIAIFGQQKQAVLARHLALPHGVLTAVTFRRVFEPLDAAAFSTAFTGWVREWLPAPVAAQICVDGQTLRGSGPQALHMVSARVRAEGLCLAQVATAGKGHELAALPDVLALLDLSGGAVVSLDALGCQPAIARQILEQGGYYLLALKRHQPGLWAEAERVLEAVPTQHQATGWASPYQEWARRYPAVTTNQCRSLTNRSALVPAFFAPRRISRGRGKLRVPFCKRDAKIHPPTE